MLAVKQVNRSIGLEGARWREMPPIQYSEKYFDDTYEYRFVFLDFVFNFIALTSLRV